MDVGRRSGEPGKYRDVVILDLTRGRPCTPTLLAAGSVIGDRVRHVLVDACPTVADRGRRSRNRRRAGSACRVDPA